METRDEPTRAAERCGDGRAPGGGGERCRRLAVCLAGLIFGASSLVSCASGAPVPGAGTGTVTVTTTGSPSTSRPATASPGSTSSGATTQPSPSVSLPRATATTSSASVESTSAYATTPTCSATDLAVTGSEASGGVGHGGLVLVFTNHSGSRCAMQGYPGAAGVNAAGAQVVQAARTLTGYLGGCHCAHPPAVSLSPGQQASSLLEGDIGGGEECLVVTSVLVTPPDAKAPTVIHIRVDDCHLQIHPVVPGATGGALV